MNISENDKKDIKELILKVLGLTGSMVLFFGGLILMILQSTNDITFPHGLIAGVVCLVVGFITFIVEQVFSYLNRKLKVQQDKVSAK